MKINALSDYRKQLSRGFPWLVFSPGLEEEFRLFRREQQGCRLRMILWTLAAFTLVFAVSDYYFFGPGFSSRLLPLRTAVSLALIALLLMSTRSEALFRHQSLLGILLGLQVGVVALIANTWFSSLQGAANANLAIYISSTCFIYFCFGLRFWQALPVALALYFGFFYVTVMEAQRLPDVAYPLMLMSLPNLVGAFALYGHEYDRRLSFLLEMDLLCMSRYDQLTGLLGRASLREELPRVAAHCYRERIPLSIAMMDIDYFRAYNEIYGQLPGDQCLSRIGGMAAAVAARPLDLAARLSGDEFVIVLPGCDHKQAVKVLQKLKAAVHKAAIPHAGSKVSDIVTVSIGVIDAWPMGSQLSTSKLLQLADEARNEARAKGRDRIVSCSSDSSLLMKLAVKSPRQAAEPA